ncbi:MAG: hypothetical protein WC882_03375 [Candidatus Gracilibacteria bacterium]
MTPEPKNLVVEESSLLGIPKYNPTVDIKSSDGRPVMTESMIQRAISLTWLRNTLATQKPDCTQKLDWNDLYVWLFTYLGLSRHELITKARTGPFIEKKKIPTSAEIPNIFWQTKLLTSDFNTSFERDTSYSVSGRINERIKECLDLFKQLSCLPIIQTEGNGSAKGYLLPPEMNPVLEGPDLPVFAVMVAIHEALREVRGKSPQLSELTAEACIFDGIETVTLFGQKFQIQELLAKINDVRNRIPPALLESPPIFEHEALKTHPLAGKRRSAARESTFIPKDDGRQTSPSRLLVEGRTRVPNFVWDTGGATKRTWGR